MSENVKTVDLNIEEVLDSRNITVDRASVSLDVDQVTGEYLITFPRDEDGDIDGDVIMYPQSPQIEINESVTIKNFLQTSPLFYPLDAKFDYVRGKIWIVDTGNDRALKVKKSNTKDVDVIVDGIVLPHAVAPNVNTGGSFVKAFQDLGKANGIIHVIRSNGESIDDLVFVVDKRDESSSESSGSLSSSSGGISFPSLPSPYSIKFDHARSRVWWVSASKVYMADTRNLEVRSIDLYSEGIVETYTVDIELSTGNAFVVGADIHDDRFVVQLFRDNNVVLGLAYLE